MAGITLRLETNLPFQVTMIPLFLLFQKMHWIGTFLPLTVTAFFGNSFFIFLIRQFFIGIPKELSYSAKVDGAGEFPTYWSIIMPLAKPALTRMHFNISKWDMPQQWLGSCS